MEMLSSFEKCGKIYKLSREILFLTSPQGEYAKRNS
jgi:hypothetical protein